MSRFFLPADFKNVLVPYLSGPRDPKMEEIGLGIHAISIAQIKGLPVLLSVTLATGDIGTDYALDHLDQYMTVRVEGQAFDKGACILSTTQLPYAYDKHGPYHRLTTTSQGYIPPSSNVSHSARLLKLVDVIHHDTTEPVPEGNIAKLRFLARHGCAKPYGLCADGYVNPRFVQPSKSSRK